MAKGPREWRPKRPGGEKYVVAFVDNKQKVSVDELDPQTAEEWGVEFMSTVKLYSAGVYPVTWKKEKEFFEEEEWEAFVESILSGEKEPLHRTDLYPSVKDALEEAKEWAEDNRFNVAKAVSLY